MSESKPPPVEPTPGNWFVDLQEDEEGFTVSTDHRQIIGRAYHSGDFPCVEEGTEAHVDDEARANAQLFAAAKKMREVLQAFVKSVVRRTDDGNVYALGELHRAEAAAREIVAATEAP